MFIVAITQNIVINALAGVIRKEWEESFHKEEGWMFSLSIQPSCHLALGYEDGNRW